MTAYLSNLFDSPGYERLAVLKPESLCPYLYYNISPYVFTLVNGGWFSWVKRTRNPSQRHPARIKNPAVTAINRQFINEVVVRCPNPGVNVIAGIGPVGNNTLAIRILHGDGTCLCHHETGKQFILGKETGEQSLKYSRLFPETLAGHVTGLPVTKLVGLFDETGTGSIQSKTIITPCRYHKRPALYDNNNLLPDKCCPHVFQQIYPNVLAVMYKAGIGRVVSASHPGEDRKMTVNIEKKPAARFRPVKRVMDGLDFIYSRLFHPLDRLDYTLTISVLDAETGDSCGMRAGRRYAVNLHSPNFLCPAGFHAVYPYLLLSAAGVKMDWDETGTENRIPCPDCAGVVYSIKND